MTDDHERPLWECSVCGKTDPHFHREPGEPPDAARRIAERCAFQPDSTETVNANRSVIDIDPAVLPEDFGEWTPEAEAFAAEKDRDETRRVIREGIADLGRIALWGAALYGVLSFIADVLSRVTT